MHKMDASISDQRSSWTTLSELPTRAVSAASIVIAIEADQECECTPLLVAQRHGAYRSTTATTCQRNYGGIGDDRRAQHSISNKTNESRRYSEYSSGSTSSNISMYYYEQKPHLCDVRLFAIFFVLISGFTIATYLLIAETSLPSNGFILDLVSHDIWSKLMIPTTALLNPLNVVNVLILHTGNESCHSPSSCSQVLSQMQKQHFNSQAPFELPFNFLVADDGQTYEARGWDHPSGYHTNITQETSIVIGFIGNYTKIAPDAIPLQSTLSLIKESVRRKKLQQNYHIIGVRNITAHDNDAEALFRNIIDWPQFQKIINVF